MINQEAIFIGANRYSQVSDIHRQDKLVAFGAGTTIALWYPLDVSHKGVFTTLKGHNAEVTCIKFIPNTDCMISASEDFCVKVWRFSESRSTLMCIQTLNHHTHSITTLAGLPGIFAVGSADGSISIWCENGAGKFCLIHSFTIQKDVLPLSLALTMVDDKHYLLAIGGTSVDIYIYSLILDSQGNLETFLQSTKLEGHEDWIKSLEFRQESKGNYILASASQDRYIRLWKIKTTNTIDCLDEDESKLTLLSNKKFKFIMKHGLQVIINFEALIIGHDDWISSIQWHETKLQLLASTADTSIIIWEPDEISGVWVCTSRLGELSSKGASTATGSSGGFWSCMWFSHESKEYILTNGKTGAWRIWVSNDNGLWEQTLGITGATKSVTDISWSPNGEYLLCTSLDQTTRLYSRWKYEGGKERPATTWSEFSRPQIHGYDMTCVEFISNTRFISGGAEKILRSFDEPIGIAQMLHTFLGISVENESHMPKAASLPALGLSNKASNDKEEGIEDLDDDNTNKSCVTFDFMSKLVMPPLEDQLQRYTLWPEVEKLYGHGYEISCVAVSSDKQLIATACKSNTYQHASIRFFDANSWLELKPNLHYHTLTITRLRFSHDNKYLLSVSRDRKWAIWERNFQENTFTLKYQHDKPHTRIIWDCAWAPLNYGNVFLTASRDKSVKVWKFSNVENEYTLENVLKFSDPITALSIHNQVFSGALIVAIGFESGSIQIYKYDNKFEQIIELDSQVTPASKINKLQWCYMFRDGYLLLGVASADTSTRIYSLGINDLQSI